MLERFAALGGTDQPAGTARHGLAFDTLDRRATDRACLGQLDRRRVLAAPRDFLDLGDHIARATHHQHVADTHILALDFVHVVQRRVGDGHPAHEHRFEFGHRRKRAGAPDLEFHRVKPRGGFFGRKLARNRPARRPGDEAQLVAYGGIIDLEHTAVDFDIQRRPALGHGLVVGLAALEPLYAVDVLTDLKAPGL